MTPTEAAPEVGFKTAGKPTTLAAFCRSSGLATGIFFGVGKPAAFMTSLVLCNITCHHFSTVTCGCSTPLEVMIHPKMMVYECQPPVCFSLAHDPRYPLAEILRKNAESVFIALPFCISADAEVVLVAGQRAAIEGTEGMPLSAESFLHLFVPCIVHCVWRVAWEAELLCQASHQRLRQLPETDHPINLTIFLQELSTIRLLHLYCKVAATVAMALIESFNSNMSGLEELTASQQ